MHLLAQIKFFLRPLQRFSRLVSVLLISSDLAHRSVWFDRTVKQDASTVNLEHQFCGRVPRVDQHSFERKFFSSELLEASVQHVSHVLMLVFASVAWIVNSVINHPEFLEFRVEVNAVDQPNASDDTVFIATELAMNERNFSGMIFVEYAVVKDQVSIGADHDFLFALLPDLIGFDAIFSQIARWCVVTETRAVLGEVRQGVVGLAHQ